MLESPHIDRLGDILRNIRVPHSPYNDRFWLIAAPHYQTPSLFLSLSLSLSIHWRRSGNARAKPTHYAHFPVFAVGKLPGAVWGEGG